MRASSEAASVPDASGTTGGGGALLTAAGSVSLTAAGGGAVRDLAFLLPGARFTLDHR